MKQEILEHEAERKQFYAAGCKLTEKYEEPGQAHEITCGEFKMVRDDLHCLWRGKSCVDTAARFNECTEELSRSSHSGLLGARTGAVSVLLLAQNMID